MKKTKVERIRYSLKQNNKNTKEVYRLNNQ